MKRVLLIFLVIALIFSIFLYPATAADDICFIAINETLLDLDTTPYFYGSIYVPYGVFSNFSIYSAYFASGNTVSLYRTDKQLYFDMNTGKVYDGKDNYYSTPIVKNGGELYVSVQFVCNFFGLNWSYIEGVGYGDVLRITDGGSYLSDSAFLNAATTLMKSRYENYSSSTTTVPTEKPATSPSVSTETEQEEDADIYDIYISFEGVPDADMLSLLSAYGVRTAFYLTPSEILLYPDIARRIVGEGHAIGINCSENFAEDYAYGAELLFEATGYHTLLISSSLDWISYCEAFASENGLSCAGIDLDFSSTDTYLQMVSAMTYVEATTHVRFACSNYSGTYLGSMLTYFRNGDYTLIQELEA